MDLTLIIVNLVIEDEKISLDELQDQICEDEDHVQSSDVVCWTSRPFLTSLLLTALQVAMQKL